VELVMVQLHPLDRVDWSPLANHSSLLCGS
jgi:hypothetical protein